MSKKSELKKYRKNTLPEIHYKNVYIDGVIEVSEGFFTKAYKFNTDIIDLDSANIEHDINLVLSVLNNEVINSFVPQMTYFNGCFYLTLGTQAASYEEALNMFSTVNIEYVEQLNMLDRLKLLHAMYQNDDVFEDRFKDFSTVKKVKKKLAQKLGAKLEIEDIYDPEYPLEDRMRFFKKNNKISKDLVLPMEFVASPSEMEFEGNYVRYFYFKNMPRYIDKEFIESVLTIDNVMFSLYFKKIDQSEIMNYVSTKFADAKDLKGSQMRQKEFFESVTPELKRSANNGETMFLTTFVLGVPNDSIDTMDKITKKLAHKFEETYVLKVLKYQQKTAFNSFLPFCADKLNIKNTIFYKGEGDE